MKTIDDVGHEASAAVLGATTGLEPPGLKSTRRAKRRRSGLAVALAGFVVTLGVAGAVVAWRDSDPATRPDAHAAPSCLVTVPSEQPFVPTMSAPATPPEAYDKQWFGTAGLWTLLDTEGETWRLQSHEGSYGQKTVWWSENFDVWSGEYEPDIAVTARSLDNADLIVTAGSPGTNGSTPADGSFMLVGINLPATGCWEVTAVYKGASLTHTVEVIEHRP